jgi:hypothetical protein
MNQGFLLEWITKFVLSMIISKKKLLFAYIKGFRKNHWYQAITLKASYLNGQLHER